MSEQTPQNHQQAPGFTVTPTGAPQPGTQQAPAPTPEESPQVETAQLVNDVKETIKLVSRALEELSGREGYEILKGSIASLNLVNANITAVHANNTRKSN